MGQKTHPIGLRLGVIKGWDSNWYCGKETAKNIGEDDKIRKYLTARLGKASFSKIGIERSIKLVTVTIFTARPGVIIGKGGTEVDKLKEEMKKLIGKEIQINISEIKRPELDAFIVASSIAKQIEGRVSFRRAIKKAVSDTMRIGAEGIKVIASGRVGGAEMARQETYKEGRIPLHTVASVLRCGSAKVRSTVVRNWCLPPQQQLHLRKVETLANQTVAPHVVINVLQSNRLKKDKRCYNLKEQDTEDLRRAR